MRLEGVEAACCLSRMFAPLIPRSFAVEDREIPLSATTSWRLGMGPRAGWRRIQVDASARR